MALRFSRVGATRPSVSLAKPFKYASRHRFLATVEGNTTRQMPALQPQATPVSHDRATFTIRVSDMNVCLFDNLALIEFDRMAQYSVASLSVPNRTFPVKPFSQRLWLVTQNH